MGNSPESLSKDRLPYPTSLLHTEDSGPEFSVTSKSDTEPSERVPFLRRYNTPTVRRTPFGAPLQCTHVVGRARRRRSQLGSLLSSGTTVELGLDLGGSNSTRS